MPVRNKQHDDSDKPETLAEMLFFRHGDPKRRRELEEFRLEYEALHGPTDLTRRYTSTWPTEQQNWLLKHDAKSYFDGLPPFAKEYTRSRMVIAARKGNLDDMPNSLLRLFIQKQMVLDHEKDRRDR